MNAKDIVVKAFMNEVDVLIKADGIYKTVKMYGHTGPFAYFPNDIDLVELLEELYKVE